MLHLADEVATALKVYLVLQVHVLVQQAVVPQQAPHALPGRHGARLLQDPHDVLDALGGVVDVVKAEGRVGPHCQVCRQVLKEPLVAPNLSDCDALQPTKTKRVSVKQAHGKMGVVKNG